MVTDPLQSKLDRLADVTHHPVLRLACRDAVRVLAAQDAEIERLEEWRKAWEEKALAFAVRISSLKRFARPFALNTHKALGHGCPFTSCQVQVCRDARAALEGVDKCES